MQFPFVRQSGRATIDDRAPIFPGWWMLAIAASAQCMSGPGQSYSVAAFKDPMQATLKISDTSLSVAYGFATLLSGLSLPLVGRWVDRFGARRILPMVAVVLGTACLWMSQVTTLPGLYLGFSLIRCSGQGALVLISMWIVGEWFIIRRGIAASIVGLGGSLSVMAFPLINYLLISCYGWQTAWMFLGAAVWLILIPPSLSILRDHPEDLGLQPDGHVATATASLPDERLSPKEVSEPKKNQSQDASSIPTAQGNRGALPCLERDAKHSQPASTDRFWTVSDVLRDVTFWKLLSVPASCGMIVTALVFHQVTILGSRGVAPGWALGLISLQAIVATLFAFPAGWLTDRMDGRYLLATAMALLGMACALVLFMPAARASQLAPLYATLLGLNGALLRTAGNVIWLNYYGRKNQGGIRGVMMSAMVLGAAIGPLPVAFSADYFGSYQVALIAFIAISATSGWLAWTAQPPQSSQPAG